MILCSLVSEWQLSWLAVGLEYPWLALNGSLVFTHKMLILCTWAAVLVAWFFIEGEAEVCWILAGRDGRADLLLEVFPMVKDDVTNIYFLLDAQNEVTKNKHKGRPQE